MAFLQCAYLNGRVELTEERERHIAARHPDLLPAHKERLIEVLLDPDLVRRSRLPNAKLFSRWYTDKKHIVLVVVSEVSPTERHWVITAYCTRRLPEPREGVVEWSRS
jgi:hypothetical protein